MPDASSPVTPATVLFVTFSWREITTVRHAVSRYAARVGLHGGRLQDFVLAVNEIVTNTAVHGDGCGELRLWINGQTIGCEVTDHGQRNVPEWSDHQRPEVGGRSAVGGRAVQLARLLVDDFDVSYSSAGTAVRLFTALPATA